MQTDMGGYQPWQAGTSGSLKAYEPTWRDKLARVLMGEQRASPERARLVEGLTGSRGMGSPGLGVVDAVPGVGQALQAQEAVRSGDTDMLAMALMPGSKQVKAATGSADDAAKAGIRAYHGSPHDFDKFDMSKIGTGEGAQAYGHGLYFAEAEDVAKQYRKRLSDGPTFADGTIVPDRLAVLLEDNKTIDGAIDAARYRYSVALDKLNAYNSKPQDWRNAWGETRDSIVEKLRLRLPMEKQEVDEIVSELELLRGKVIKQPGAMYEVRINADPNDFLDWDKPLSQQSEKVRGAIEPILADRIADNQRVREVQARMSGGEPVTPLLNLGDLLGANVARGKEQALRDAGIPGIKYLDQGSRTAGEGSRNYVVFRDDIIDIVKKYGIAAAASMYGMDQVQRVLIADQLQPAAQ